jgi:eukaryotic-like serine/threonine-protein kinase
LEGQTLRRRLQAGPLEPEEALRYGRDIAAGLAAAHARGIVHRDLKPDNVFLAQDGAVKILDFGIARATETALDAPTSAAFETGPGQVIGTVGYMSPEQLCGVDSGPPTDVFAFGVVIHEMLVGRAPFQQASRATSISAVLNCTRDALPPPLSFAEPVVATCLQKEPGGRYASGRELLQAIDSLRVTASTTGGVFTTSADTVAAPGPPPIRSIAVLPFADMSTGKQLDYLCEGVAEEILSSLSRLEGLRVVARSSAFQFKAAAADVRTIASALSVDAVLEGSVRLAGDRLRVVTELVDANSGFQLWSERFDRRLDDVFAVQDEIANAVATTLHVRLRAPSGAAAAVGRVDPDTYTLVLKGRHHWNRRTEAHLQRSIEYFQAAVDRQQGYAEAHAGLAQTYATLGIYGVLPPDETMPLARTAAATALAINPALADALATLASVHALYDWQWTDAEREFRRAISLVPGASTTRAWFAMNLLVPCARFAEAEEQLRHARDVDPLSLPIATGFGVRAYYAGEYEEAIRALSAAIDLDGEFAIARYFRALALAEIQHYDGALTDLEAAMRVAPGSIEMLSAHGYVLARAGSTEQARQRLGELRRLSETKYVSPGLVAQIHAGLGDAHSACDCLAQAVETRATDAAWIGVRPTFQTLHGDSRFDRLRTVVTVDAPA